MGPIPSHKPWPFSTRGFKINMHWAGSWRVVTYLRGFTANYIPQKLQKYGKFCKLPSEIVVHAPLCLACPFSWILRPNGGLILLHPHHLWSSMKNCLGRCETQNPHKSLPHMFPFRALPLDQCLQFPKKAEGYNKISDRCSPCSLMWEKQFSDFAHWEVHARGNGMWPKAPVEDITCGTVPPVCWSESYDGI